MLDSIRSLTDLPDGEDAHLAREDIAAARRRRRLQLEAQRRARECVEQARREAEAVHAEAFRQGYAEGVLRAVGHLAEGLSRSQSLGLQLRNALAEAARDLLAQALEQPQWLNEMLQRWLVAQPGETGAVLQLLLPAHCRERGDEWRERLRTFWAGGLLVEYHLQNRYVLRLGDQLLEFDVETTRQRLEPRLLACIEQLPASVHVLDQGALQALEALCSSFTKQVADAMDDHED
ncbi:oxygen-regulated invasion protein OrgB [Pseudomonas sp. SMV71]|uniref:oxygen-regulated invasion protein OrgB n=1 Tax=Pseudomonas sp. SMV71 TaxID=3390195 RepID=UPI003F865200